MKRGKAMSEAGLFIGWGEPARGREKEALEIFNKSVTSDASNKVFFSKKERSSALTLHSLGRTVQTSAALPCYAARRSRLTRFRVRRSFRRIVAAVRLRVDGLGLVDAIIDEELAKQMGYYQDAVGELG